MEQSKILFNGKQHEVLLVRYADGKPAHVIAVVDKVAVDFYDVKQTTLQINENSFVVDFEKVLIDMPSTINQLVDGIKRKIEAHEEVICDMSIDFVEAFREARKAPFASGELFEQADLIEKLGYVVDGLHEALGVVLMKGDSDA